MLSITGGCGQLTLTKHDVEWELSKARRNPEQPLNWLEWFCEKLMRIFSHAQKNAARDHLYALFRARHCAADEVVPARIFEYEQQAFLAAKWLAQAATAESNGLFEFSIDMIRITAPRSAADDKSGHKSEHDTFFMPFRFIDAIPPNLQFCTNDQYREITIANINAAMHGRTRIQYPGPPLLDVLDSMNNEKRPMCLNELKLALNSIAKRRAGVGIDLDVASAAQQHLDRMSNVRVQKMIDDDDDGIDVTARYSRFVDDLASATQFLYRVRAALVQNRPVTALESQPPQPRQQQIRDAALETVNAALHRYTDISLATPEKILHSVRNSGQSLCLYELIRALRYFAVPTPGIPMTAEATQAAKKIQRQINDRIAAFAKEHARGAVSNEKRLDLLESLNQAYKFLRCAKSVLTDNSLLIS